MYACECMQRHLNGVQDVASSNLAAPNGLSKGSVDSYGRAVFLAICNGVRNSDNPGLTRGWLHLLSQEIGRLLGKDQLASSSAIKNLITSMHTTMPIAIRPTKTTKSARSYPDSSSNRCLSSRDTASPRASRHRTFPPATCHPAWARQRRSR